ncbi:hypothetical protein BC834DRAFT_496288 [Gloeopeniophorella convolvens]|nr:hypothetical protein BC834DRAFT_496288 [Gloeopeniophorella convolvens]
MQSGRRRCYPPEHSLGKSHHQSKLGAHSTSAHPLKHPWFQYVHCNGTIAVVWVRMNFSQGKTWSRLPHVYMNAIRLLTPSGFSIESSLRIPVATVFTMFSDRSVAPKQISYRTGPTPDKSLATMTSCTRQSGFPAGGPRYPARTKGLRRVAIDIVPWAYMASGPAAFQILPHLPCAFPFPATPFHPAVVLPQSRGSDVHQH